VLQETTKCVLTSLEDEILFTWIYELCGGVGCQGFCLTKLRTSVFEILKEGFEQDFWKIYGMLMDDFGL